MSNDNMPFLTWVEVSKQNLQYNIKNLKSRVGPQVLLAPSVKANAYGHGLIDTAKIVLAAGADWLCINALFEAEMLRKTGIRAPIYLMGYVLKKELEQAVNLGCRLVTYNKETVAGLAKAAKKMHKKARIHIKIETGNNRQGVAVSELLDFVKFAKKIPEIEIEGASTHFANIEDIRLDAGLSAYPKFQLNTFKNAAALLGSHNIKIPLWHCANSGAAILFPQTHMNLVRPGISVYGLWSSKEVKKAVKKLGLPFSLLPALSWKTRIAQIKEIPAGAFVGYGCTFQTRRKTRLAILPVGYYDGYDRGFSNCASVLIHGRRSRVLGRVCMNMIMVDVTDIPKARVEDIATLLGPDGREEITAEELAELAGTINYEITTRIREGIPRIMSP